MRRSTVSSIVPSAGRLRRKRGHVERDRRSAGTPPRCGAALIVSLCTVAVVRPRRVRRRKMIPPDNTSGAISSRKFCRSSALDTRSSRRTSPGYANYGAGKSAERVRRRRGRRKIHARRRARASQIDSRSLQRQDDHRRSLSRRRHRARRVRHRRSQTYAPDVKIAGAAV